MVNTEKNREERTHSKDIKEIPWQDLVIIWIWKSSGMLEQNRTAARFLAGLTASPINRGSK